MLYNTLLDYKSSFAVREVQTSSSFVIIFTRFMMSWWGVRFSYPPKDSLKNVYAKDVVGEIIGKVCSLLFVYHFTSLRCLGFVYRTRLMCLLHEFPF